MTPATEEPSTFLILISLVFRTTESSVTPNKPDDAMIIAKSDE